MASVSQLNPYQCDQCGTTNIVAAPVLYQQGTRAYSGTFSSGTSQSYSAQVAAPPSPRGYGRPPCFGDPILLFVFGAIVGFRSGFLNSRKRQCIGWTWLQCLLLLAVVCLEGCFLSFRRIARYNREVYPRLHWNWEHTYICRRCGKLRLIPS
jgi:hypothetical protein